MPSNTKENYLKAIYALSLRKPEVSVSALSRELKVSVPTANSMVKKLMEEKWVKYEKYKPLLMTAKGKKLAAGIIRKHRLTEMFLVDQMGFGWEEVHDIAEEMEHIDSERLFDRMDELLDYPIADPHGSPIPAKDGTIPLLDHRPLTLSRVGETVELCALGDSSKELLTYLNTQGISLRDKMTLTHVEPYDGSVTVTLKGSKETTLSVKVAECLMVKVVGK